MKHLKTAPALITVLILVSCCVCGALADGTWTCPNCGQSFSSNFCPNDGTARPTPTPAPAESNGSIVISDKVEEDYGHITLKWEDPNDAGPYTVSYRYVDEESDAVQVRYEVTSKRTSVKIDNLIPGKKYQFTVTDNNGTKSTKKIKMPSPDDFSDGKLQAESLKISTDFRYLNKKTTDYSKAQGIKSFKAREMMEKIKENGRRYGLKYKISIPQLSYSRDYDYIIAFYAPNGFSYSLSGNIEFNCFGNARGSYFYWYCLGENFFAQLYKLNDDIPTGKYHIELYLNGMFVSDKTFKVT